MEDQLAVHATGQAAGMVGLLGHCHLAFLLAGHLRESDGCEEENLCLL